MSIGSTYLHTCACVRDMARPGVVWSGLVSSRLGFWGVVSLGSRFDQSVVGMYVCYIYIIRRSRENFTISTYHNKQHTQYMYALAHVSRSTFQLRFFFLLFLVLVEKNNYVEVLFALFSRCRLGSVQFSSVQFSSVRFGAGPMTLNAARSHDVREVIKWYIHAYIFPRSSRLSLSRGLAFQTKPAEPVKRQL